MTGEPGDHEFSVWAARSPNTLGRRDFVRLLGASAALAGLQGCIRAPDEAILPYVDSPLNLIPGVPQHYATAMTIDGYATGLLVESYDGRPTKIEGNPVHPASLGSAGVFEQASVLDLYNPRRIQAVRNGGQTSSWEALAALLAPTAMPERVGARGAGLGLLLPPTASPLQQALLARLRSRYPDMRLHFYAPLADQAPGNAARSVFDAPLLTHYDLSQADVIVSLGADVLASGPFHLRHARDFSQRRRAATRPAATRSSGASGALGAPGAPGAPGALGATGAPGAPGAPGALGATGASGASGALGASLDRARAELFMAEWCPSPTSTLADARLQVSPFKMPQLTAALLSRIVADTERAGLSATRRQLPLPPAAESPLGDADQRWVERVMTALLSHRGRSVVLADASLPESVHILVHALNAVLGNVGNTVWYAPSPIMEAAQPSHDLANFASALDDLDTLIVCDVNVCYSAPVALDLPRRIAALPHTVFFGELGNETASSARWLAPAAHYLESWGLERAYDGTVSIVQPLIAPLYEGRTVAELLALLDGRIGVTAHQLVREESARSGLSDDAAWNSAVRRGVVPNSTMAPLTPEPAWTAVQQAYQDAFTSPASVAASTADGNLAVVLTASRAVYDGRFAENAWLQEFPDPVTSLVWDNAALISPASAAALGVATGDVVEVRVNDNTIAIPALIVRGHADDVLSIAMGYGQQGWEGIAHGVGVNVSALRSVNSGRVLGGTVRKTGAHVDLALAQPHAVLDQRAAEILGMRAPSDVAPTMPATVTSATATSAKDATPTTTVAIGSASTGTSRVAPAPVRRARKPLTLYEPRQQAEVSPPGDQWAMVIDLDQCIGCGACVVACQSENNIPVVGKDDVLKGRAMHWLRIDRYVDPAGETIGVQPMLCQHCEHAPCEYVCPVNATVHSEDGLNEMVYNRCVGTRFCSNNCPYKVRRFNWYEYNGDISPVERMQKNPEVTVRARGVMEKCTFCVQRVRRAQQDAILSGAEETGPVQTACQQTCPAQAIVFGSLTSTDSEVLALSANKRAYSALEELGTIPRVRYLARDEPLGP